MPNKIITGKIIKGIDENNVVINKGIREGLTDGCDIKVKDSLGEIRECTKDSFIYSYH